MSTPTSIEEGDAIQSEADAREDARRDDDEADPVGAALRAIETIEREEAAHGGPLPEGSPFWIRLRIASERGKWRPPNPTGAELAESQRAFWGRLTAAKMTTGAALRSMGRQMARDALGLDHGKAADLVDMLRRGKIG